MTPKTRALHRIAVLALALVSGCAHFVPRPLSPAKSIATFNSRSLTNRGLRAFLADNRLAAPVTRWDLKALTLAALYYQPALAEARDRLLEAEAARVTAGERPNPSVSMALGYDTPVAGAPSPWIVPINVSWPIETAGKRAARLAQARHLAAAARWRLIGTVWQVRSRVRSALLDLYAARRSESLLTHAQAAEAKVVRLLQGQLEAGMVSSYLVAQAQSALDSTILARQAAAGAIRQARIRLAGALGVAPHALTRVRLSFGELHKFPRALSRHRIIRRALLQRADVRAALEQYAASQSALQFQIARQWPGLQLGPGFAWNSQMSEDSEWQLGVSLPLPLLNHNQGPIAEARAERGLAAAHFLSIQADALEQIDAAVAGYRSALGRLATAISMRRNLRRQLEAVRAQVHVGERQPLDLADAEIAFDRGAENLLAARIDAQRALGTLEDAVQSPLTVAPSVVRAAQNVAPAGAAHRRR